MDTLANVRHRHQNNAPVTPVCAWHPVCEGGLTSWKKNVNKQTAVRVWQPVRQARVCPFALTLPPAIAQTSSRYILNVTFISSWKNAQRLAKGTICIQYWKAIRLLLQVQFVPTPDSLINWPLLDNPIWIVLLLLNEFQCQVLLTPQFSIVTIESNCENDRLKCVYSCCQHDSSKSRIVCFAYQRFQSLLQLLVPLFLEVPVERNALPDLLCWPHE